MPRAAAFLSLLLALPLAASAQTYTETTLANLPDTASLANSPQSTLIQAADGYLYGTSRLGGANGYGNIFRLSTAGTLANLYSFTGNADGGQPSALVQMPDGSFYGVTGRYPGTIFHLTVSAAGAATLNTVYTFSNDDPAGYVPNSSLVLATDGNLYGVNDDGGDGYGTLYRVDPATGLASPVHVFSGTDGDRPIGALVQNTDGLLYGTSQVTTGDYGTLYSVSTSGTFTLLDTFSFANLGEAPQGSLVVGPDGSFYGLAGDGGTGDGTIFKFVLNAATPLTTLYTFSGGANGGLPSSGLFLASDGQLYGTTVGDSTDGKGGNVFAITTGGTFTNVFDFDGTNGDSPAAGVLQAGNGSFYGSTAFGGTNAADGGVLYRVTKSPALAGPVQLSLSASQINLGGSVTLSWKAVNAFSTTLRQCDAFIQDGQTGAGQWSGVQTGTGSSSGYSGSASLKPTAVGVYTYALTCGGTESGFANLTVVNPTTTTVTATPNPVQIGQLVNITATVKKSSGSAAPTGNVTFYYGTIALETLPLNGNGVATLTVPTQDLPAGTYPITAAYAGDANDSPSNAPAANIVVALDTTTTTLAASPATVTPPASVTFTATVKRSAVNGAPTGTVTFYFATTALSTATVNASGVATYTISTNGFPAGTYALTAKYSGDAADAASTSNAASITVK